MESTSKIRVYTNGLVVDGVGAYSYIVLESGISDESPSLLRAKFTQAGKTDDDIRMKMRAVYEGVRHCPDGADVEIHTDNFLLNDIIETADGGDKDADIASRYRRYIAEHHITPQFMITKVYNGKEFPCNDHDEWTWYAHWLCEFAIKKFKKENK